MSKLSDYRKEKDEYFMTNSHSPLTRAQRQAFTGLKYFPENPALRLQLSLDTYPASNRIEMQTSSGNTQDYYCVGQVRFSVLGQAAALQVYQSESEGEYFIPFVDATAPAESYGAGRYLEPENLGNGSLLLDFNLAYNPYCAYNDLWNCPIPPSENRIAVRIEAGEKKFHD